MGTTNIPDIDKMKPLFWEYDWQSVQAKLTSNFVMARVLEFGTPEQFATLVAIIGEAPSSTFSGNTFSRSVIVKAIAQLLAFILWTLKTCKN